MQTRNFEYLDVNGVTLRTVVEGEGPLIVLLHGWPQSWYLWRHQIDPLVTAGYKVAVPDQRGYGGSSKPPHVDDYHIKKLTDDVDGIRAALGYDDCIVIGQDWGCVVAWITALRFPETCRAVMGLSVPFWRFNPAWIHPKGMDDQFWYMRYFQEQGVVEAELDSDIERSLRVLYYGLSADSPPGTWMGMLNAPKSSSFLDALGPAGEFSSWLTEDDLQYYVGEYKKDGFRGPCNWYRNIPLAGEMMAELANKRFTQPAAFAAGSDDDVLLYDENWRENFPGDFDDLRFIEIVDGAGHWVQAEAPAEVNKLILRFLDSL